MSNLRGSRTPDPQTPSAGGAPADAAQSAGEPRRLRSTDLLAGETRVAIEHQGEIYTLRRTRNGRLILTK